MDASQKQDLRFSRLLKLPMYLWSIVFVFVALLYVIGLSFLSRGEVMGVTDEITLKNYARLASPDYLKVLLQSLKLAALTTLICIAVGYPFGYLMARLPPVPRSVVMLLIIVPFWTVTVPLTLSGLMAGCVLVFIPSMGLFFLNDLLGGSKSVLAGGLIQQLINSRDLPMAAALSVLLLAVTGAVIAVYRRLGGTGDMSMF